MKSKMFALLAIVALVGFTGCCGGGKCFLPIGGGLFGGESCTDGCYDEGCGETCCDETCGETCGGEVCCEEPARCGLLDGMQCKPCGPPPAGGPMTGAVAYPYYTNRGPRDFLAKNPPSIGP